MIELITAFVAGVVISTIALELRKKRITADDAIRLVDNKKELIRKIPDLMKKMGWQFLILPGKHENNIRGIVTKVEPNYYDKRTGFIRTRIKVEDLNGGKEWYEFADYFDRTAGKLRQIEFSSGVVLALASRKPNRDDRKENIEFAFLEPAEVEHFQREAEKGNAIRTSYERLRRMFERLQTDYDMQKAELTELKMKLRDIKREFDIKCRAVVELEAENRKLWQENNALRDQMDVLVQQVAMLKGLGVDASKEYKELIDGVLRTAETITKTKLRIGGGVAGGGEEEGR